MDLCLSFLLRFGSKNKILKPYHTLLKPLRDSYTEGNNPIAKFTKHYHVTYIELEFD